MTAFAAIALASDGTLVWGEYYPDFESALQGLLHEWMSDPAVDARTSYVETPSFQLRCPLYWYTQSMAEL